MGKIALSKESQIQTISLGTPNLGLFLDIPSDEVPLGGWSDGYGFVVNSNYRTTPVRGRERLFELSDELEDMPEDTQIYGLYELRSALGVDRLYVFIGNKIAVYNGATWAWVTLPDGYSFVPGRWQCCQFGNSTTEYLVCCSEGNEMLYIDHTGTATCPDTSVFYETNLAPKWCAVYQGRVWIGGDAAFPTSIFASDAGGVTWTVNDPEETSDCQELIVGWRDGEPVNGIFSKHGILFLVKENSVWYLDGTEPDPINWSTRKIRSGIGGGTGCGYSIQDIGSGALYMAPNGDLRTLYDTDKAGLYDSVSLSAGQIRAYLRSFWYDECSSIVDHRNGWYLISAAPNSTGRNTLFAIFDFSKRTESGRGPWYRVAPMEYYDVVEETSFTENSRACFGESLVLSPDSSPVVISGGYNGAIYKEFAKTAEDLDNGETAPIRAWFTGPHIHQEDFTEVEVREIKGFASFGSTPSGASLYVGAIIDPLENNLKRLLLVDLVVDHSVTAYWGNGSTWGSGKIWGAKASAPVDVPVSTVGRTFALHVISYGSQVEIFRLYVTLRTRRT
jgi:hypothetical protein